MSIRIFPPGVPETSPFTTGRDIKPGWLSLIKEFPDRFVLGSDTFYSSPKVKLPMQRPPLTLMLMGPKGLVNKLPADLGRKVGYENAVRLYRLND